jgi:hypothetical protein
VAEDPLQEIAVMQFLHPAIPYFYPLQETMHQIECCVTNGDRDIFSMMPYCVLGDVIDQISSKGAMNASAARNMMRHLLDGLEILQHHGINSSTFAYIHTHTYINTYRFKEVIII